ncbi:DUF1176 domain-containing protein [Brevundimonas sp. GN22]
MLTARILAIGVASASLLTGCNEDEAAPTSSLPITTVAVAAENARDTAGDTSSGLSSETKAFRDWTAICDNVNNCAAYGPGEDNGGFVLVKLAAGPEARPRVYADSWALQSPTVPTRLDIDGRNYAGVWGDPDTDLNVLTFENPSDQLLRALANGQALTLSANAERISVSLTGAAAAFLWIDERQGRLGTTTALVRKGDRPASSVPDAPTPPRIRVAAPVSQTDLPKTLSPHVTALPRARECASLYENKSFGRDDWAVHRLGTDTLLWELPCGAGAYNFSQAYVLSANDGSGARALEFPTPRGPLDSLVNSSFDSQTNTIGAFGKGRGVGDCGSMASWAWTGREFALLSEDNMSDCLGIHWDIWPSTWRTAQ